MNCRKVAINILERIINEGAYSALMAILQLVRLILISRRDD